MAEDKTKNNTDDIIEEDDDEEPMIYTLEYDDGTIMEAEAQGIFEVGDKEYIALIPNDDSDDVYIYGYEDDDSEGGRLIDIEDDKEFEAAVAEYDKIMGN